MTGRVAGEHAARSGLRASEGRLVDDHDLLVVDLDGVVYVGARAVRGAVESLAAAARAGTARCFATNNASRTPAEVAEQLRQLGIEAGADDVVTSSQAAAELVREHCGERATVLAIGGPGVAAACQRAGLRLVASAADRPAAVVQGYGDHVGWTHLAEAAYAVQGGAWWVATNTDQTLPTERGPAPGNGTLVAAVRAAVDTDPVVAGKPEPALFDTAARRAGARRPLVVGDRLDTDLAGAANAGQPGLLVLTGVTGPLDLLHAPPSVRPAFVAADLGGLLVAHQAPTRDGDGWRCGHARVAWVDDELTGTAREGTAGSEDLLRAAAAAAWTEPDRPVRVSDALAARWQHLRRD